MASSEQNLSNHLAITFDGIKRIKVGIVTSTWNNQITDNLLEGALAFLKKCGIEPNQIISQRVPGSFELPLSAQWLIESGNIDGVICLGSVIKGETDHFDFVCNATSLGIKDVSLKTSKPVIFGVLTDNTKQQALDRSGGKHGNKGIEAAATLVSMLKLKKSL